MDEPAPSSGRVRLEQERALRVLALVVFANYVGFANVVPLVPLYVLRLGAGSVQEAALWSGAILGIGPFVSGLVVPVWGALADRRGHKPMLLRTLVGFVVLYAGMAFVTAPWQLLALQVLMGLIGGFQVQAVALASTLVPRRRLAHAIGAVQVAQLLGTAVGPILGGLTSDHLGFRGAYLITAALNVLATALVVAGLPGRETRPAGEAGSALPARQVLAVAGFVPMMAALGLTRLLDRALEPLLPLLVLRLHPEGTGTGFVVGVVVGLGMAATGVSALVASRAGDRFHGGQVLVICLLAGVVLVTPLPWVGATWQLVATRVALGLAVGGAFTLALSFAVLNVPPRLSGTAFGVLGSAGLYGTALGGLGSGTLAQVGLEVPFLAASALYGAAALAVALAIRQRAAAARAMVPPRPQTSSE